MFAEEITGILGSGFSELLQVHYKSGIFYLTMLQNYRGEAHYPWHEPSCKHKSTIAESEVLLKLQNKTRTQLNTSGKKVVGQELGLLYPL